MESQDTSLDLLPKHPGSLAEFKAQTTEKTASEVIQEFYDQLEQFRMSIIESNIGRVGLSPLVNSAGRNDG